MSVRVVARVRPLLPKELDKDVIVRVDSSEDGRPPNVVKIPSPKNEAEEFSFTFNGVYDRATTQEELFNAEVAPHIKALFQGLDITIFAYGVTGTGKTHTMRGGMKLADRGVIPRILSHVFRRGKKIAKDSDGLTDVDVALSYYEIYNDKVYDLLEPLEKRTPTGLPLREKDNKTYVIGLSEQACVDLRDFERLYIAANQNRVTAATKLNAHSSRSHAILRVKVTQITRADDGSGTIVSVRESTASAIDLAGSEDNRRTDNGRERLVESAAINKSLFVLSQCVDAIARGEKRIPYRESKMTRILSLGQNNGITIMILNLAPIRSYHLDTLSSLTVSSRAKRIEVREIENELVFKQLPRSLASSTASSSAASSMTSLALSSSSTVSSVSSSSATGSGLVRQPLRALTSSTHNIQTGNAAAKAAADKPVKAFSVYTDRAANTKPASNNSAATAAPLPTTSNLPPSSTSSSLSSISSSRMGPLANSSQTRTSLAASKIGGGSGKRPSDLTEPRVSKLARPSIHPYSASNIARPAPTPLQPAATTPLFSAEQIEAIIERKVAEALAARAQEEQQQQQQQQQKEKLAEIAALELAAQQDNNNKVAFTATTLTASSTQNDLLSEAVQKRLDALERRIDDSTREDDPRAEGLRCLLMARQHKEVGDDAIALHYYEQALPFFPGQAKLLGKIEKLKAKMARRDSPKKGASGGGGGGIGACPSPRKKQLSQKRKRAAAVAASAMTTPTTPTFRRIAIPDANYGAEDSAAVIDCDHESDADAEEDEDDVAAAAATAATESHTSAAEGLPTMQRRVGRSGGGKHLPGHKVAKTSLFSGPTSSSSSNNNGDDADDESRSLVILMTPRKKKLLDIVNSRDVVRIRGLAGVSARKARGLVAFLERGGGLAGIGAEQEERDDEEATGDDTDGDEGMSPATAAAAATASSPLTTDHIHHIETLAQLRNVPGMGGVTVERAYEGLVAAAI